jgi:hypothetical protein
MLVAIAVVAMVAISVSSISISVIAISVVTVSVVTVSVIEVSVVMFCTMSVSVIAVSVVMLLVWLIESVVVVSQRWAETGNTMISISVVFGSWPFVMISEAMMGGIPFTVVCIKSMWIGIMDWFLTWVPMSSGNFVCLLKGVSLSHGMSERFLMSLYIPSVLSNMIMEFVVRGLVWENLEWLVMWFMNDRVLKVVKSMANIVMSDIVVFWCHMSESPIAKIMVSISMVKTVVSECHSVIMSLS